MNDVSRVLSRIEQGDPRAGKQLLPLVYRVLARNSHPVRLLDEIGRFKHGPPEIAELE
jgi:hypothetical protein